MSQNPPFPSKECLAIGQNCHSGRAKPRIDYGAGLMGRDPWFERLTTLSEVEGESRKIGRNQIIVDPGSRPARQDLAGMTWPLMRGGQACPGLDPGERVRRKKT